MHLDIHKAIQYSIYDRTQLCGDRYISTMTVCLTVNHEVLACILVHRRTYECSSSNSPCSRCFCCLFPLPFISERALPQLLYVHYIADRWANALTNRVNLIDVTKKFFFFSSFSKHTHGTCIHNQAHELGYMHLSTRQRCLW